MSKLHALSLTLDVCVFVCFVVFAKFSLLVETEAKRWSVNILYFINSELESDGWCGL